MANKLLSMLIIKRILQLLEKGKKVKVIAGELNISVNTVRKYAQKLLYFIPYRLMNYLFNCTLHDRVA